MISLVKAITILKIIHLEITRMIFVSIILIENGFF